MNQNILVPTDFSEAAYNAVRFAQALFKDQPCKFYFLNAFQISGYSVDSPFQPDVADVALQTGQKESETNLAQLLARLAAEANDTAHQYETIATYNSLLHAVKSTIAEKDIDMVIMGTKGITGAESLIFGTNAINIMEGITTCPVLSVPLAYGNDPPREIVFPTDFKSQIDRKELNYLIWIANLHKAPIKVLHIQKGKSLSPTQKENKELLAEVLKETDCSFHSLSDHKVHRGIGVFVKSRESNMIVFMNRKHSILDNILSRPLVKELGYHYEIPMLALNQPA